jgi:hypothetical protein
MPDMHKLQEKDDEDMVTLRVRSRSLDGATTSLSQAWSVQSQFPKLLQPLLISRRLDDFPASNWRP